MKYRTDFVTNSSSSSFICEICGDNVSGYDMGLDDAGMYECINGHIICEADLLKDPTEADYDKFSDGDSWQFRYEMPEEFCPICQFVEYSENDMSLYLKKVYGVSRDEVFAIVKEKNKRRKVLYNSEYVEYVCNMHNLNINNLIDEIRNTYVTYAEFKKYAVSR